MFLDLVEENIKGENWRYERYDGSMNTTQKEYALDNFKKVKDIRILICSIKSGGVGLNLTCANRVFLMDPWWNVCKIYILCNSSLPLTIKQ